MMVKRRRRNRRFLEFEIKDPLMDETQVAMRTCLRCREKFKSLFKGNRICPNCNSIPVYEKQSISDVGISGGLICPKSGRMVMNNGSSRGA